MAEQGKGLSRRQEQAIQALLVSPTVKRAARRAGLSYRALKGYLQDPRFREEYRRARLEAREHALGLLANAAAAAVGALRRNLRCGTPAAEVKASQVLLEQGAQGALEELA